MKSNLEELKLIESSTRLAFFMSFRSLPTMGMVDRVTENAKISYLQPITNLYDAGKEVNAYA